jgi:hypothetical protein
MTFEYTGFDGLLPATIHPAFPHFHPRPHNLHHSCALSLPLGEPTFKQCPITKQ